MSTLDKLAALSWRLLLVAAALALVVVVLVELRLVVLPVIVALFLAAILVPPVRWLTTRGWPPLAATLAVSLGSLLLIGALIAIALPRIAAEMEQLPEAVGGGLSAIREWLTGGPLDLPADRVDRLFEQVGRELRDNARSLATGLLSGARLALEVLAMILLTLVILFFFMKDGDKITHWVLQHVQEPRRELLRVIGAKAWMTLRRYILATALIGLVEATLIGIGLLVIGVPLVLPLVLLTFFGAFFPLVGAVLAGFVAVLVALVSKGVIAALLVAGITLLVQEVEGDVLAPILLGRAVRLHPLAVLLALASGAVLAGVIGAFLSVPVTAVAVAVAGELRDRGGPGGESSLWRPRRHDHVNARSRIDGQEASRRSTHSS